MKARKEKNSIGKICKYVCSRLFIQRRSKHLFIDAFRSRAKQEKKKINTLLSFPIKNLYVMKGLHVKMKEKNVKSHK